MASQTTLCLGARHSKEFPYSTIDFNTTAGAEYAARGSEFNITLAVSPRAERAVLAVQSPLYLMAKIFGYLGSALALHTLVRFVFQTVTDSPVLRALTATAFLPFLSLFSERLFPAGRRARLGMYLGLAFTGHALAVALLVLYCTQPYFNWLDTFDV